MFTLLGRNVIVVLGVGVLGLPGPSRAARQTIETNDFAFLQPWFEAQPKEREKLAQRGVVVRVLPADRNQISVLAACAVAISPSGLVARVRAAGDMERSELAAGRFGNPPALADLAGLSLDRGDFDRIRQCRPGDCRLNLADDEMSALQVALTKAASGSDSEEQQAFRRVVLNRVARYRSGGLEALPEYHDSPDPVRPAVIFSEILQQSPYLRTRVPAVAADLERLPFSRSDGAESSLQWAKVIINRKAVVIVTHVSLYRPDAGPGVPTILILGKQVFASRYMNGELMLTMLFAGPVGTSSYLVHVERSHLDTMGGLFGGLKRAVIESRIREEAAGALALLRDRLERGQ